MAKDENFKRADVKKILAKQGAFELDVRLSKQRAINELERDRLDAELDINEKRDVIALRRRWANSILRIIEFIVLFDFLLVALLGFRIWSFDNPTIIITIIAESFVKVIGLGTLVVAFLFDKNRSKQK